MVKLNLVANNTQLQKIKDFLETNASEILADKINNGVKIDKDNKTLINKKDLNGFWKYATEEAKKQSNKGDNGAWIDDETVYGWAIHYFEEESIVGALYNEDGSEYKLATQTNTKTENKTKTTIKTASKTESKQSTLFDLFNINNEQEKTEIENELVENEEIENEDIEEDEEISEEEIQDVLENESKNDTRIIDYETGEIIEKKEEIKTFDIDTAKMLYSILDGKLTMK